MATDQDRPDPDLAGLIARLEDRPPATDLWPGIRQRIRPAPRPGLVLRWPAAIAAALALLAGGATLATVVPLGGGRRVAAAPEAPLAAGTSDLRALPAGYGDAAVALDQVIDRLEEAVAAAAPSLEPAARQRIQESLAALDEAIADARLRVDAAPGDLDAARYLTRTMQRKLDVLQSVATLTQQRS
ncbi:MAG: hypothetical protein KC544_03515 [Gemmatimonadetes bacterium]|nr:hypothetical protein [Gemmatimonadota bacterium]MCB9505176.1 hypothetical protein [Gemmatimonadales bacterium]HPF61462.1 hypothetical protein [Gemmatimonadales bacterium]HRX19999.1 hypothetical protein [Gemmatimonadales bacterium]